MSICSICGRWIKGFLDDLCLEIISRYAICNELGRLAASDLAISLYILLQAMTPWMQLAAPASTRGSSADVHGDLNKFAGDARELFSKTKVDSNPCKLGDTRQGNISVEIWKRAFADALKRLCPPQGEGLDCGCLPVLKKMVGYFFFFL